MQRRDDLADGRRDVDLLPLVLDAAGAESRKSASMIRAQPAHGRLDEADRLLHVAVHQLQPAAADRLGHVVAEEQLAEVAAARGRAPR